MTATDGHEPKMRLTPISPEQLLDRLMPQEPTGYGSDTRRSDRGLRLFRSETVHLDRYSRDPDAIKHTQTMWTLHRHTDDYSATLKDTLGHFHREGANLIGFCPNENLTFAAVNKLIALLPVYTTPTVVKRQPKRSPTPA